MEVSALSKLLNDRKRFIQVTAGNLRQNHLYVSGHYDFFPSDVVRGSKKNGNGELPIEIFLEGLNETIKTDIGSDAKTGNRLSRHACARLPTCSVTSSCGHRSKGAVA
jgi:hypothetical protein